jgi:hypothetical protein
MNKLFFSKTNSTLVRYRYMKIEFITAFSTFVKLLVGNCILRESYSDKSVIPEFLKCFLF